MKVRIADIVVGERFRKEYGDIQSLALSMSKHGLLHPIVVDDSLNLIAGGRRLQAAMSLAWPEIECNRLAELDEFRRRELELEENVCREDLSWQERVSLVGEIHRLNIAIYGPKEKRQRTDLGVGGWGFSETAETLKESRSNVMRDVELDQAIKANPDLALEKNKFTAYKKHRTSIERALREELAKRVVESSPDLTVPLENVDCRALLRALPANSVSLCITDPPWGVDYENETFDDAFSDSLDLMDQVFRELSRVLVSDAHVYVFFATKLYHPVKEALSKYFFVNNVPLVWVKDRGGLGDWDYKYTNNYETIFYCWQKSATGTRKLSKRSDAVLTYPLPTTRIHPTEKPVSLLRYLIEMSTVEGELVLDPFAGSASTLIAALQTKRRCLGAEKDPDMYKLARTRLVEELTVSAPAEVEEI